MPLMPLVSMVNFSFKPMVNFEGIAFCSILSGAMFFSRVVSLTSSGFSSISVTGDSAMIVTLSEAADFSAKLTKEKVSVEQARAAILSAKGVLLTDELQNNLYPMPLDTSGQDKVFVGRIREDLTNERGLNIFCCGDQVRKGAAANAVQIAQLLI